MKNNLSVIERLDNIRRFLAEPGINHNVIIQQVLSVFRDVKYIKRPIIARVEAVIRASKNREAAWFDNINKFSYPPKNVLKGFGRCNCPGEPVFYCSNENAIPVFEVKPSIDDSVVLSHWKSKQLHGIEFYCVALGIKSLLDHLSDDDILKTTLLNDDVFKDDTPQDIKDIDNYVGKLFIEDANNTENFYWFSYAIAKAYLGLKSKTSGRRLDGIIYPSVAGQLTGYNIALTQEFVDKELNLSMAMMYKVISIDEKKNYKLLHEKTLEGSNKDGSDLKWKITDRNNYFEFNPDTIANIYTHE